MALPSQSGNNNSDSRSVMGQPSTSTGSRVALVIAGLVLLAGGVYALGKYAQQAQKSGQQVAQRDGATDATPGANASVTPGASPTAATGATTTPTGDTGAVGADGTIPFRSQAETTTGAVTGATTGATTGTTPTATGTQPAGAGATGTSGTTTTAPAGTTDAGGTLAPTSLGLAQLIEAGNSAIAGNRLVEGRRLLSQAYLSREISEADKQAIRERLTTVNQDLVFGTRVEAGDPLVESYKVQPGDSLVRIRSRRELATDWRLIQRVNRIQNANALRAGQTLKLVRGPFHAVVHKNAYRVDIFAGSPDDPASWLYIRSYNVGLGEGDSTPLGNYTVKRGSKLINPPWINPRTGERFGADDPNNPIGERWVGWQGLGDSAVNTGYGFHGTIDPTSIGAQKSMGCVRLGDRDVEELYELMTEEVSIIRVLP